MKKTILSIYTMLFVVGLLFTACDPYDDQNIVAPTVNEQEALQDISFKIDAKSGVLKITEGQIASDSIALLTVTTTPEHTNGKTEFILQLSKTADFKEYQALPFTYNKKTGGEIKVSAADLNVFLISQDKDEVERSIYARLVTYVISGGSKLLLSGDNSTAIKATPYVKPLKPFFEVTPKPYYIIGMANGAWNNSEGGLGESIFPLGLLEGDMYTKEGAGTFVYTGYFWANRGFKIIGVVGSWDEQWGSIDGVLVHNDGGSGDIKVAADGYYTVTLDSENNTLTIIAANITPKSYTEKGVGLIGNFTGWGSDIIMLPTETNFNHMWYASYTFEAGAEGKFREVGNWDINWGGIHFPMGIGTQGGENLKIEAGTYTIILNDITGTYYFIQNNPQ
ncbi:MAG: SusF/SusE family outer membrane protein [Candidatus Saccharimonadaceae bacterium]